MIKFLDTLTRQKETFEPISGGKLVKLYTCGPTVHDFAHIGNLRAYIWEDVLKRYLKFSGYEVEHIMNITDVDDKTIRKSQEAGRSLSDYTEQYTQEFFKDLETLGTDAADDYPRATGYVAKMIEIIEDLLEKEYAYKGEDGSIYYSVARFPDYGKLAHIEVKDLEAGASGRVAQDEYTKDNVCDFALWKAYSEEDGDVVWDAPFGKGRPGWHIECSAMSMALLGNSMDIHCGGVDNIFPHHQNEIAQSEAYSGEKFVKYWLHCNHLQVDGEKMSKSLGNFYTLRDVLEKGYSANAFRYFIANSHYRSSLNFTFEALEAASRTLDNLGNLLSRLQLSFAADAADSEDALRIISEFAESFTRAMDDDLNCPEASGAFFRMANSLASLAQKGTLFSVAVQQSLEEAKMMFTRVFGVEIPRPRTLSDEERQEVEVLITERAEKRAVKEFEAADALKAQLSAKQIEVVDTKDGTLWFVRVSSLQTS